MKRVAVFVALPALAVGAWQSWNVWRGARPELNASAKTPIDHHERDDAPTPAPDQLPEPGYRARARQATAYQSTQNDARLQETLAATIETALTTPATDTFDLPLDEQRALFDLLQWSIYASPERSVADQRLAAALAVIERLALVVVPNSAWTLGDLAERATSLVQTYEVRYPVDPQVRESDRINSAFVARAERLRAQAVFQGTATPDVYLQSAMLASRRGDYEHAVRLALAGAERAAAAPSGFERQRSDLRLFAARCLLVLGRHSDAQPHLAWLLTDPYNSGWGHFLLGRIAVVDGNENVALQQFLAARARLGDVLSVRWEIAKVCLALQRWREAMPLLESLVGSPYEDRATILTLVGLYLADPSPESLAVKQKVEARFPRHKNRAAELAASLQDAGRSLDEVLRLDREPTSTHRESAEKASQPTTGARFTRS